MQILIQTSRSINKDRLYQTEQEKKLKIHIERIRNITQSKHQAVLPDLRYEKQLRKAKSAAKLFEKQQTKLALKLQNKVLLTKLINVQPTIKAIRIKKTQSTDKKMYTSTSSNWLSKKKQQQKIIKQNQILKKKFQTISNVNLKDVKKKMKEEIKEYLELRDQIRKIKTCKTPQSAKQRATSFKKISMGLPLGNESNQNNEEQIIMKDKKALDKPKTSQQNSKPQKAENPSNKASEAEVNPSSTADI